LQRGTPAQGSEIRSRPALRRRRQPFNMDITCERHRASMDLEDVVTLRSCRQGQVNDQIEAARAKE
jgi:hypothetical protein